MSVLENYGISENEWDQLDDDLKRKLIAGQAKLTAQRQMLGNESLEDDERDIRKRTNAVTNSLLGQDANSCKDKPAELGSGEDVRISVFGDINGDKAVAMLSQNAESNEANETTVTNPPPKQPSFWGDMLKQLLPLLVATGVGVGAAWYFGGMDTVNEFAIEAIDSEP